MTACVPWWGYVDVHGYGKYSYSETGRALAHRLVWEACFGAIPAGCHVHHVCGVRHCVNPEHLQVLTAGDHTRLHHPRVTHCKRGHAYDATNTYTHPRTGLRKCKRCRADGMATANRQRRMRLRAA